MSTPDPDRLERLRLQIQAFDEERDWNRFHSVRNLVLAVLAEAGELAAEIQWLDDAEVEERLRVPARRRAFADELGDILIHLVQLSSGVGVDLVDAASDKLARNADRYPVGLSKGDPTRGAHRPLPRDPHAHGRGIR